MKNFLINISKNLFKNKGAIVTMAKDEAVDMLTSSAKGFVWRYILIGNIIVGVFGFAIGCLFTYMVM